MSITEDFEEKAFKTDEHGYIWKFLDVIELLEHARSIEAQNEELKAMLRKLNNGFYECPICRSPPFTRLGNGHSPDCALAKLIK